MSERAAGNEAPIAAALDAMNCLRRDSDRDTRGSTGNPVMSMDVRPVRVTLTR
jgi:hypothetical protein